MKSVQLERTVTENGSVLNPDQINTLYRAGIIPKDTPSDQILVFAQVCRERGLSPFSKEIYLVRYDTREGPKYSIITGIDGFRKVAARTGELAGCDDARYDVKGDGSFKTAAELKMENSLPVSCTVTVYRMKNGQRMPFTATCLFDEYAARKTNRQTGEVYLTGNWKTMPIHMLAKCAEAFALKKGFDDQLTGIREESEIAALSGETEGMLIAAPEAEERKKLLAFIRKAVKKYKNKSELGDFFRNNPSWHNDDEIIAIFEDRVKQFEDAGDKKKKGKSDDAPSDEETERMELLDLIRSQVSQYDTKEDLEAYFKKNPQWKDDDDIIAIFSERAKELKDGSKK